MPSAGRILPNTIPSGSFTTPSTRLLNTITLRITFVPRPKNAFQSPAAHRRGRNSPDVDTAITPPSSPRTRTSRAYGACCLRRRRQRVDQSARVRDPAEDATLRLDHLEPDVLKLSEVGRYAVREDKAVIAAVVGFAHGSVHADFSRDAADDELSDPASAQDGVKVGSVECALSGFVHYGLARERCELVHDVVPVFPSDQDTTHGTGIPDAHGEVATEFLRTRQICEIRSVPFAGMHDEEPGAPHRAEHALSGRHRLEQQRCVVSERGTKSTRVDEIPLHVDDHERRRRAIEQELIRLRRHLDHGLASNLVTPRGPARSACRCLRPRPRPIGTATRSAPRSRRAPGT